MREHRSVTMQLKAWSHALGALGRAGRTDLHDWRKARRRVADVPVRYCTLWLYAKVMGQYLNQYRSLVNLGATG